MQLLNRTISISPDVRISSLWAIPDNWHREPEALLILAHGAGSDMHNPFLSEIHERIAQSGTMTVKFNFPYKERGGRAPDRKPVLEATWRAVTDAVRNDPQFAPRRLVLGGRSMGGRIASHLAADGEDCAGLILLGYPLHPPNKHDKLRTAHLPSVQCPMLFVQGTRDPLCNMDLLDATLKQITAPVTLLRIEGGDHSFKVLKRLERSEEDVMAEIVAEILAWLDGI